MTPDLRELYVESDALGLAEFVRQRQVSPLELVDTAISVIEALDPKLNAVVIRTFELARTAARLPASGPFGGVPFVLKNIGSMWQGTPLTNGCSYMQNFICGYDSEMTRRIKAAGFLLLGRTNAPEVGWCIGTEPQLYGPTINPWNPSITPGGSSGGAAVAVAARMVPLAEASDGGGSIRVPASCCGLVGLKPSRGRITYGPQMMDAWHGSIATFCVTRTVRDTAAFLDAVAGPIAGDPYVAARPATSWLSQMDEAPARLLIGYTLKQPWGEPFAPEVKETLLATLHLLQGLGHDVEEHDLPEDFRSVWADYNVVNAVETALEFERLAITIGRPVEQGELAPFNWSLLQYGRSLSAMHYGRSIAAIRNAGGRIAGELARYDVFITPTLTQTPRPVGYWSMQEGDIATYLERWADAGFMFVFNLSGLPAMSVPVGLARGNTPLGLQLVGRHADETTILRVARQLEHQLEWAKRRPAIVTDNYSPQTPQQP